MGKAKFQEKKIDPNDFIKLCWYPTDCKINKSGICCRHCEKYSQCKKACLNTPEKCCK